MYLTEVNEIVFLGFLTGLYFASQHLVLGFYEGGNATEIIDGFSKVKQGFLN